MIKRKANFVKHCKLNSFKRFGWFLQTHILSTKYTIGCGFLLSFIKIMWWVDMAFLANFNYEDRQRITLDCNEYVDQLFYSNNVLRLIRYAKSVQPRYSLCNSYLLTYGLSGFARAFTTVVILISFTFVITKQFQRN